MKWATLICLLLFTIVSESRHLKKRDADHHARHIGGIYLSLGQSNLKHVLLAMVAQNLQKCSIEEHEKVVEDLIKFAKHCSDHENEEDCNKPMMNQFYDHICKIPNLKEGYSWTPDCCAKQDLERTKCFSEHKDIEVEPYKIPDAAAACTEQKEHPDRALHHYIDNIGKRHSSLYPPAVVTLGEQYGHIVTECCEAEEKEKCFGPKFIEIKKATFAIESKQKHICYLLSAFPERVSQARKLAKFAQKYPGADFSTIHKLTLEYIHVDKDCCKGDQAECMLEKMEATDHICENQDKISPNLKPCCDKSTMERKPCMIRLPHDPVPADLPKEMPEFVDEHVCKNFEEQKDAYLAKFLFEFSRRHSELSTLNCLRVAKGYEALITKCCAEENPLPCYQNAPQLLEAGIKAAQALAKQNCDAYEKFGPYGYNVILLSRYVVKMPEVSDETLLEITGKMTKFAGMCCSLPKDQIQSCAEDKLDILLGDMCERQSKTFINDQVRKCCTASYADCRPCFTNIGISQNYVPPAFHESSFQVGAEICKGTEEEQKKIRLTVLIHVLKVKPDISQEKLHTCIDEFTKVREKCCAEANQQLCLDTERAGMILHLKEALGV